MSAHTRGPWTFVGRDVFGQAFDASARVICKVHGGSQAAADANTLLIAAAPDMLAALQMAKRLIDEALPKFNWGASALDANAIALLNDVPGAINSALAKARGEQ